MQKVAYSELSTKLSRIRLEETCILLGTAAPFFTENSALAKWKKLPKPFASLGSIPSWPKRQRALRREVSK